MASYVQLGRGFRPNYEVATLRQPRRRYGGRGVAATLGLVAAVFAAGLLLGRLDAGSNPSRAGSLQPMQYYPR